MPDIHSPGTPAWNAPSPSQCTPVCPPPCGSARKGRPERKHRGKHPGRAGAPPLSIPGTQQARHRLIDPLARIKDGLLHRRKRSARKIHRDRALRTQNSRDTAPGTPPAPGRYSHSSPRRPPPPPARRRWSRIAPSMLSNTRKRTISSLSRNIHRSALAIPGLPGDSSTVTTSAPLFAKSLPAAAAMLARWVSGGSFFCAPSSPLLVDFKIN